MRRVSHRLPSLLAASAALISSGAARAETAAPTYSVAAPGAPTKPTSATLPAASNAAPPVSNAAPSAAPAPAANNPAPVSSNTSTETPLPDPWKWHQDPAPVVRRPAPVGAARSVEVGLDLGVVSRPATGGLVHYAPGMLIGGHARVSVFSWLGARLAVNGSTSSVSFDEGALGLPKGTGYDQQDLQRVHLAFTFEPTWSPLPKLDLWAGAGIGWGRTQAQPLTTTGAEIVNVPARGAVYVEVPLSIGARYEILPDWLVVNVSGAVGFLSDQSGQFVSPYRTPGKAGTLVDVGAFPELGTSWALLAGLGVLL